jgi:hypothetical protein
MSVVYSIDRSERVVHLTTVGDPSFDEWRDALLSVFSDSSFETGFDFISDRRRASPPGLEFVEGEVAFVREHERELGRCRWAAVIPDAATDSAARAVTERARLAAVEVGFFYNLEEARRWLRAPRV